MRKFDFKKLALMGITGGVMCATQVNGATEAAMDTKAAAPTAAHAKMDEALFMTKLNAEGKETYMKLSQEGKTLALKLGNSGEFTDMNEAVKAAHKQINGKTEMTH